jgi:hypothetical protein
MLMLKVMQVNKNRVAPMLKNIFPVAVSSALCTTLVIFLLVLPFCYGIDLTGLGERLEFNTASIQEKPASAITAGKMGIQTPNTVTAVNNVQPVTQPTTGVTDSSGEIQEAHQDAVVLTVPAKQNRSFRFYMERDYDLSYNWATDGKPLYCELRGENPAVTANPVKVFGKLTETRAKGFFISPFTGNFTLYWENKTEKPISIRLTAKGVYTPLG